MALSPKSNSAHLALDNALNDIRSGSTGNVPNHIKTNSTTYKYPHDYKNDWVYQEYLPENLKGKKYYVAKNNKYENNINKLWNEMKGDK
jgi:putative ATPase